MAARASWTFLSNHGHVLLCLADDPGARLRDIAARVGITERTAFGIIESLEQAGIIARHKVGRRNTYTIDRTVPLRHEIEAHHTVGDLIELLR